MAKGEKLFEEIKSPIKRTPKREWKDNSWIRPGTWALVNERVKLQLLERLTQAEGRQPTQRIHAALKGDKIECVRKAGEEVMAHHVKGDSREACCTLYARYRLAEGKTAKPCYHKLETQLAEREKLYNHIPPPGEKVPRNVEHPRQNKKAPSDNKIRRSTKRCGNGRLGGRSKM